MHFPHPGACPLRPHCWLFSVEQSSPCSTCSIQHQAIATPSHLPGTMTITPSSYGASPAALTPLTRLQPAQGCASWSIHRRFNCDGSCHCLVVIWSHGLDEQGVACGVKMIEPDNAGRCWFLVNCCSVIYRWEHNPNPTPSSG